MIKTEDPKLQMSPRVVLDHLPVIAISVSKTDDNLREISYIGCERVDANGKKKYLEYRVELVQPVPSRNCFRNKNNDQDENDTKKLTVSEEFNYVFNINGIKDDMHSILDVLTGQKMSTNVLDSFFTLRIHSHNMTNNGKSKSKAAKLSQPSNTKWVYLNLHFMPIYDKDQKPETFKPNLHLLPTVSLNDCIIIAPQYVCRHYYLIVIQVNNKQVYVYDSSWEFVPMFHRFHQIRIILRSLFGQNLCDDDKVEDSWDIFYVEKCTQQQDEFNCGCYVAYFVENELKGKSYKNEMKISVPDLIQIRHEIVKEILPSTSIGSQLLEAISV